MQAAVNAERARTARAKLEKASARAWDRGKLERDSTKGGGRAVADDGTGDDNEPLRPSEEARLADEERRERIAREREENGGELLKYRPGEVWDSVEHRED